MNTKDLIGVEIKEDPFYLRWRTANFIRWSQKSFVQDF
ncbi:hypothetical protein P689_122285 [Candidatus Riesia pediculischaeffi PTSU]|uniref:Uncharacterized protein n=1 Tax=Candidatus Riesia pediculischaeffi PTSU TaxID=1401651 RepID=A0A0C1V7L1_9ENTR|nr:hypothetical protein P689_122285 [Candidatus Riesia pediculischaeffi PTSU]